MVEEKKGETIIQNLWGFEKVVNGDEGSGWQVVGTSAGTQLVIIGHNNEGIIFFSWMLARLNNSSEAGSLKLSPAHHCHKIIMNIKITTSV